MKVLTLFGTRPEIIRLSQVIKKLDQHCEHILVYTGQNFDRNLSDIFFQQLDVRQPDVHMGVQSTSFADQAGQIIAKTGEILSTYKPDRLLILGDTNSGLGAIVAARMGIKVYHMEAGNRCYDDRVPEEINRRIIDHSSDVLMPYTERSRQNLLQEGIRGERIFVTGNPILEVINAFEPQIQASTILKDLKLEDKSYFLVTMHRAENVDLEERLKGFVTAFDQLQRTYQVPVIVSTHPRTRHRMEAFAVALNNPEVRFLEPFGFFDFIKLEKNALCVLSDSGTVQEECAIFKVANVTIRDVTERPETIECGSNILTGGDPEHIQQCVKIVLGQKVRPPAPSEYLVENVSDTVAKIVLGYLHKPR